MVTMKQLPVMADFSIEIGFFSAAVFRAEKYGKHEML